MEWRFWIALALAGAALLSLWVGYRKSKRLGEIRHWGKVPARIVSAGIEQGQAVDGEGRRTDFYEPKLVYEYEADGETRRGNRISQDGVAFANRRKAEAFLADKQLGSTVPVWVDPENPDEALLTVEGSSGWGLPILFFLLAVAVAVGLFDRVAAPPS